MSGTVSGVLEEALRLKEVLCRGGFIDPASTQFQIHSYPQKSRPVRKERVYICANATANTTGNAKQITYAVQPSAEMFA